MNFFDDPVVHAISCWVYLPGVAISACLCFYSTLEELKIQAEQRKWQTIDVGDVWRNNDVFPTVCFSVAWPVIVFILSLVAILSLPARIVLWRRKI